MNLFGRLFKGVAAFAILAGALLSPSLVRAQTATVRGTALDPSGAAVVGATVTATNISTSIDRTTETTDTGAYSLPSLPPSVYTFTFTKPGFKAVKFENIALTVDQQLTLDAKFELGSTSTTVEVAWQLRCANRYRERDPQQRGRTHPNDRAAADSARSVPAGFARPGRDSIGRHWAAISVNGGRERNNNFLLDGADNNDAEVPGVLGGLRRRTRTRPKSSACSPTTSRRNTAATTVRSLT